MNFNLLTSAAPSKADIAKNRLLEAGLKCFSDRGLEGVTIREIAKESRLNSAAITYYFGSKEGLYQAVLEAVMRFFRELTASTISPETIDRQPMSPQQAKQLIQEIQRNFALGILHDSRSAQFAMLMVREQTQPSASFDALYHDTIEPLHRMFSTLLATVSGKSPDAAEVIIRAHAVIGQLQGFIMARATVLRRLNWTDYNGIRAEQVIAVLSENLDLYLDGLQAQCNQITPTEQMP